MIPYKSILTVIVVLLSSIASVGQDLDFYIQSAIKNSPLIQDNKNQSEAARLEADRLRALYTKSQVFVTGTYTMAPVINHDNSQSKVEFNPEGPNSYSGYDIAVSNGGVYQGLLNFNQPLFNGVRYQTSAQQVIIGSQINQNTIQLSIHDLERFITDQYILCLQDYRQADYLAGLIKVITEQTSIVSKLVEGGIAKQSDLSLLTIEQKTQQVAYNTFRATYRRDLMDLRVLCGITDTTFQVLSDINLQPHEMVKTSGFTERYRLDSLNLLAAQKIFELKYKPQVSLFANGGLNAVYAPTIPNRLGVSAGLNLTINLTDGRQREISRQRTDVLTRTTKSYKDFFYNQNAVRKGRILAEVKSLDERYVLAQDQLKEYAKLLEFYKQELMRGQISVINYITTLKNLALLQRDIVILKTNRESLINLYNYWNW